MSVGPLPRYSKSDYGPEAARVKGVKRRKAAKRGWGTGWPNPDRENIHEYDVNRVTVRVHDQIAPLVTYLIRASNALGYDIRRRGDPDGGVGSFDSRPIKGSRPPQGSIHSLGTALDLNTKGNPRYQTKGVMPPFIVDLFESSGFGSGVRFAGGWVDFMHVEYLFKPTDVVTDLANAKAAFTRLGGTALYPTLRYDATPNTAMVRVMQNRLTEHGYDNDEEGRFDMTTDALIRSFQRDSGLGADGIVGPLTWAALNLEPEGHEEPPADE